MTTPEQVVYAAQLACLLEASAEKPGNVTPNHAFRDMAYEDFVRSALAIGPVLARAGDCGVGETVLAALQARRRVVAANTNLGIVLLLAPLARAALLGRGASGVDGLRAALHDVLAKLSVADTRFTYAAIRIAAAGGLGQRVDEYDVNDESAAPTITLREAMALAVDRDNIAREYLTDFAMVFEFGVPAWRNAQALLPERAAVVQLYLQLLAQFPDTLIARKRGKDKALEVSGLAADALARGGMHTEQGQNAIKQMDALLRQPSDGNTLNPGTTADLVAATLFVTLSL